jgi:hypothetical protein
MKRISLASTHSPPCVENGRAESTLEPSGIFSRGSENWTNCKQNLIIVPDDLILTVVMFCLLGLLSVVS